MSGLLADLDALRLLHQPVRGEARQDPHRYCCTCANLDGSRAEWPCPTMKVVQRLCSKVLKMAEQEAAAALERGREG